MMAAASCGPMAPPMTGRVVGLTESRTTGAKGEGIAMVEKWALAPPDKEPMDTEERIARNSIYQERAGKMRPASRQSRTSAARATVPPATLIYHLHPQSHPTETAAPAIWCCTSINWTGNLRRPAVCRKVVILRRYTHKQTRTLYNNL